MLKRTSLKAKIIFLLLPVFFLALLEIIYGSINLIKGEPSILNIRPKPVIFEIPQKDNSEDLDHNLEIQSRLTQPQMPFHKPDPDLYWKLKPECSFSFRLPNESIINYKINKAGFRGEESQSKSREGKLRIICAGDSSTFGFNLNLEDTYPYRLSRIIENQSKEKNAEVINAGVWCYSSYQGRLFIEKELVRLEPDILLLSYGFNDSQLMNYPDSQKKKIKNESRFSKKMKLLFSCRCLGSFLSFLGKKGIFVSLSGEVPRVNLDEFSSNIDKIISLCKSKGIKLIFLPISVPVKYADIMEKSARDNNIVYIDMEACLKTRYDKFLKERSSSYKNIHFGLIAQRTMDTSFSKRYGSDEMMRVREWNYVYMDHCHPSPVGNQIIAEEIFKTLVRQGYFTKEEQMILYPVKSMVMKCKVN